MPKKPNTPARSAQPLIPVSWGEVIDKITILEIKAEMITARLPRANVKRELAALSAVVAADAPRRAGVARLKRSLRRINLKLWKIEDAIRQKERDRDFGADFVKLARSVYRANDERAAVKREINTLLGSALIEEKSYSRY